MLIPVWMGLAPVWYDWFAESTNGHWMKWLYNLLEGRWLVNIPIVIVLTFLACKWCLRILNDSDIRLYRPILVILGLMLLHYRSNVEYSNVVFCITYREFFSFVLVALLIAMMVKILRKLWSSVQKKFLPKQLEVEKEEVVPQGFTDDKTNEANIPDSLKKYAGEIVERLLVTDIREQSFALGVTGEWGVGKTTFLDELKKSVGERADIVEFNPWMCSSPEQVTSDFFSSLRHQLSYKHSRLAKSIREYAKYVNNVTVSPHSAISIEALLPVNQEGLFERKRALSAKFSKLPKPVLVVIDDVDRLERDEVFEVLRLIRNTADLSNVIYLVAYDKEYVTSVLEEKEIKDSTAYLEKIFPVEVHLPKVEEHLVWNTLYLEIKTLESSVGNNFADMLFKRFESDDKELILKVLDNYRRAKRFARLYMLNMAYLVQQSKGELKLLDVFWLELLQIYDKKSYDVLADEPGVLLFNDGEKYRIKEGILKNTVRDDKNKYEGEPFWKEQTPNILEKMFGKYVKTIRQSICFIENYEKFFTLSVSPFRLSINEMNNLFEDGAKPEKLVRQWVGGGKYFSSIAYQFKQVNINKLNDNQLNSYLSGLLCFNMKVAPYRSSHTWEVKKMLLDERYVKGVDKKAHDIVIGWFEEMMKEDKQLPYLSKMLHRFYITTYVNPDGKEETMSKLLISNDEVESILAKVIEKYLKNHPEAKALDILSEKGVLPYIFGNCCVEVKDAMATENYCEYKQVGFETVINHFAAKEEKPTFDEYEKTIGSMFNEETPVFDNPADENIYWEYAGEAYDKKMREYFGSSYDWKECSQLKEFKERCFIGIKEAGNQTAEAE